MINVAIIGASGFTGLELTKILNKHPFISKLDLYSFNNAGKILSEFTNDSDIKNKELLKFSDLDFNFYQVIFFACPNGTAMKYYEKVDFTKTKVIDLAADYRLDDEKVWEEFYEMKHQNPQLLAEAIYGIPELNRDKIKEAKLVANPGCYPTAAILALYPLLKEHLIEAKNIIIDAKSGYSGAGRNKIDSGLGEKINENFIPYNFSQHRHTPEIIQELSKINNQDVELIFSPQVLPIYRGILETIYVNKNKNTSDEDIQEAFKKHYANENFISYEKSKHIEIKEVALTNNVSISFHSEKSEKITIISAIDNLIKGAAGQAVQNMNIMMDFDETTALINE